jgi:hypothetical protein
MFLLCSRKLFTRAVLGCFWIVYTGCIDFIFTSSVLYLYDNDVEGNLVSKCPPPFPNLSVD